MTNSPSKERSPLLAMRDVRKGYGGVAALDNVSFDVDTGEIVGLLGDNGAGKSTLVNVMSGVIVPDSGSISWQGQPVSMRNRKWPGKSTPWTCSPARRPTSI